jgi:glutathione S-transferase
VLLYDSPPSGNAYKARLLLAHLDLEYERRLVDVVDRSNKREELDGLNPMRRVPTLVLDDGRPIAESGAYTHIANEGNFDLGPYPAVCAWHERVAAVPGHVPMDA